jgi:hypothetical protein
MRQSLGLLPGLCYLWGILLVEGDSKLLPPLLLGMGVGLRFQGPESYSFRISSVGTRPISTEHGCVSYGNAR